METEWVDEGVFWAHQSPQGTDEWKAARKGRPTASMFLAAAGENSKFYPSSDEDPTGLIQVARYIAGIDEKKFSDKSKEVMAHGTKTEPIAREWYAAQYNVEVIELGLAVPKWDKRIGASTDGIVVGTDKIIEIKCPLKMYDPLKSQRMLLKMGMEPERFDHDHIWPSHYAQMQGTMAILGRKLCDYVVYSTGDPAEVVPPTQVPDVYVEEVEFNPEYWNNYLYPKIDYFIREYLDPLLVGTNLPSNP